MHKVTISPPLKDALVATALVLLFGGFLFSRFLLSAGTILFILFSCIPVNRAAPPLSNSYKQYYVLLSLLLLIPFLSGAWSIDKVEWWARTQVKLPLLLFPLAFWRYGSWQPQYARWLGYFFIAAITAGTAWSMIQYLGNTTALNNSYHYAGVIPTPMDNDHVRFSWAVLIAILLAARQIYTQKEQAKVEKTAQVVIITWLVIYLHLLAAKTGLLGLYLSGGILMVQQLYRPGRVKWLLPGLITAATIPVLAYWLLPSFHHRIHYILYDFEQYTQMRFPGGLPDGARVLSWIGGWQLFSSQPITGIGYGDIWGGIQQWYTIHYPHTPAHDRLFPSNQYLLYACGCGAAGLMAFTTAVVFPLLRRTLRRQPIALAFHASAILLFFPEMHLEGQYGVFLYCFFALWFVQPVS